MMGLRAIGGSRERATPMRERAPDAIVRRHGLVDSFEEQRNEERKS